MNNDPNMMAVMQQLMADPEIMAIMQKPDVMAKLQQLMANPAAAVNMMGDPDLMKLMTKMQSLQLQGFGGGGGAGGFGGMMGGGGAPPSASALLPNNNILHVRDEAQFNRTLADAKEKLVVVDFFTTWCGPCKRIAPVFEQLASVYSGKVVFVKIDGDASQALVASKGVKGFPTFHFYLKGSLIEQFSGANEDKLRSVIRAHAEMSHEVPCPYKHFPLKDTELVTYKDCRFDIVTEALRKSNTELLASTEAETVSLALLEDELKELDALCTTLNNVNMYHNSKVSETQIDAVEKLLKFPVDSCMPALHLIRMAVRHPQGAAIVAKRLEEQKGYDIVARIVHIANRVAKPAHADLALRALTNMLTRRALAKVVGGRYESVLEGLVSLSAHQDVKVRLAFLGLLVNFAILFKEDAKLYAEGKVHILSNLSEFVAQEKDKTALYRALVVLGTLIYRDANTRELANGLEFQSIVENQAKSNGDDANITQVSMELLQELQIKAQ